MRYPGSTAVALSYVVRARMREIGLRPALGATPSVMLSNTLLRGVTPAIAGVDSSVSPSRRHGVRRSGLCSSMSSRPDVGSFAGGAMLLLLVAIPAAFGPARRASRIEPSRALRTVSRVYS